MNRIAIAIGLLGTAVMLNGCSTQSALVTSDEPAVYLSEFGAPVPADSDPQPQFFIGAGDALGQAVFMNYVLSLNGGEQTGQVYAIGADPRPE